MEDNGAKTELETSPEAQYFYGQYTAQIEEVSGRLLLPVKWRPKNPDDWFGLTLWPIGVESHLLVFPAGRWSRFLNHLYRDDVKESELVRLERVFAQTSDVVRLDKIGRITIREDLLKRIGVEKDVVLVGRLTKWELFSPKAFSACKSDEKKTVAEFYEEFAP
jgi:MraZ protein